MMKRRGSCWCVVVCAWAMFGSVACSYLDEDMALSDEAFEQSLAEEQIYDMGEMTIGGIGMIGIGGFGCGGGHWGHHGPHRKLRVRHGGASSIIMDEPEEATHAISPEEEALAWMAFKDAEQPEGEPAWGALEATARAGGAHFVEAEARRKEGLARAFGEAGAMR